MKNALLMILAAFMGSAGLSHAAPVPLDVALTDATRCGAGNGTNGIQVTQVTGNLGGASECWGTFDGNNPKKTFTIGSTVYYYAAKQNTPGGLEGADIGLKVTPTGGAQSGNWEFTPGALGDSDFLIVLKAASKPGYAAWLFSGADNDSFKGSWQVSWGHDLSHLSVYAGKGTHYNVPVPGTLALLGIGILALRLRKQEA